MRKRAARLLLFLPAVACQAPDGKQVEEHKAQGASVQPSNRVQQRTALGSLPSSQVQMQQKAMPTAVSQTDNLASDCPPGMNWVKGGRFQMGSPAGRGASDEHPRFTVQVAGFCMAETETTVQAYSACVESGKCTPARSNTRTCNAGKQDRLDHPINCVTWDQAHAFCQAQGQRLPTEPEWEYSARGGEQLLAFPWGEGSPDGKACWKRAFSCPVTQHAPAAFGLRDMVGNVWEWVSDRYGPYPWPSANSPLRVYRGGSWSRRFEKWMRPTLRNRYRTSASGSHLGFRCALSPKHTRCPSGADPEGGCLRAIEQVDCTSRKEWNGARCASKEAPTCRDQFHVQPGRGCVLNADAQLAIGQNTADPSVGVRRIRSPKHDSDCVAFQASRPRAYRLIGGTHVGRNRVGKSKGCKNRDVGVGWNSACCP